jgi:HSP20 family molecular chaperone IbpA
MSRRVLVSRTKLIKEDVKIEVTDDGLTISGESKHEHEERGEGFYRWNGATDNSTGLYRCRRMPILIECAEFNNGVLEISAGRKPGN